MIAYLVTNTINGKQYVGISKHSTPDARWLSHVKESRSPRGKNILLKQAIRKYGSGSFIIDSLASARTWKDLCEVEVALIAQYQTFWVHKRGYNMTLGGDGTLGSIPSRESRDRQAAAQTGKKRSEQARANLKAATQRRLTEQLAWLHTPASREKAALSNTGKKRSAETRCRLGLVRRGSKHTDAAKSKMSASRTGRPLSAEHKLSLSAAGKGRKLSEKALANVRSMNIGTILITDGQTTRRIKIAPSDIPEGWSRGTARSKNKKNNKQQNEL